MIAIDSCRLCVRNYLYRFVCSFVRTRTSSPLPLLHAVSITHCVFYFHRCHQLNWFSTASLSQPIIYFSSLSSHEKSHELISLFRNSWVTILQIWISIPTTEYKQKKNVENFEKNHLFKSKRMKWRKSKMKMKKKKSEDENRMRQIKLIKTDCVHVHDVICKCKWWY